jgi:hypothetical protein
MTLLEAALRRIPLGPRAVDAWLGENPQATTPDFVAEVKRFALEAMQRGAGDAAITAYLLAGSVYRRNGDRRGVLSSQLNQAEVMFLAAQTTDAYADVFSLASNAAGYARQAKAPDVAWWAVGLAADSAFWGSEAAATDPERLSWLQQALEALVSAEDLPDPLAAGASLLRTVSVLVAIYQRTIAQDWGPAQPEAERSLQRLAALAERVIPVDYRLEDARKTEHTAHHLAALSQRYGSAASAEARLKAIAQVVKSDTWSDG